MRHPMTPPPIRGIRHTAARRQPHATATHHRHPAQPQPADSTLASNPGDTKTDAPQPAQHTQDALPTAPPPPPPPELAGNHPYKTPPADTATGTSTDPTQTGPTTDRQHEPSTGQQDTCSNQDPPQTAQAAAAVDPQPLNAPAQTEPAPTQGGQRSTSTDDSTRDHGSQRVENKAMKYVYKQHNKWGNPQQRPPPQPQEGPGWGLLYKPQPPRTTATPGTAANSLTPTIGEKEANRLRDRLNLENQMMEKFGYICQNTCVVSVWILSQMVPEKTYNVGVCSTKHDFQQSFTRSSCQTRDSASKPVRL